MILNIDAIAYSAATRHLRETKWIAIKNEDKDKDMDEDKNEDKTTKSQMLLAE
jgi:hypothetical protein